MVEVRPHSYTAKRSSLTALGRVRVSVLEIYFVGDAEGYRAGSDSSIIDDASHFAYIDLPGARAGTEVRATAAEVARWTAAQHTAETALRDAEAQYLDDIGLVGVRGGKRQMMTPAPGWRAHIRRLRSRRSHRRAAAAYRMRIEHIRKGYAPVGEEIEARVYEVWRHWNSTREVATQARWEYRFDRAACVVYVVHDAEASLDTGALVKRLLEIRRSTDVSELELHWDDASRTEIERRSGVDFDTWWRILTLGTWVNAHLIPNNELDNVGNAVHSPVDVDRVAGRIWPYPPPYWGGEG